MSTAQRFRVVENEGSFFYETHLVDSYMKCEYSINAPHLIPPGVIVRWCEELLRKKRLTPDEARFLIEVLRCTARDRAHLIALKRWCARIPGRDGK